MAKKISRRKLAEYAARQLTGGTPPADILRRLAAYLVDAGRVREADLLVRDIEERLSRQGYRLAKLTTAFPLQDDIRAELVRHLGKRTELDVSVDKSVLGGFLLELPGYRLDATLSGRLNRLSSKQMR